MTLFQFRAFFVSFLMIAACGVFSATLAELSTAFINQTTAAIDTLRKGDFTVITGIPGTQVSVKQKGHHFGFGAAMPWKFMRDTSAVKAAIGPKFLEFFEWVTPENEMKWWYTDTTRGQPCKPGFFGDADSIVAWALKNGLKVRGHNLFWNERVEYQAYCARPYGPYDAVDSSRTIKTLTAEQQTAFLGEMTARIDSIVPWYKGKVTHWDAVNEIIHFTTGDNGAREIKAPGLLATWTGKTGNGGAEIFSYVLDRARTLDPLVKLCVNEYNVIERSHQESDYVSMIKKINSGAQANAKIDIIGLEGHFGDLISRTQNGSYAGYESVINTIAQGVDINNSAMKFWFTEVDWNNKAPGNVADNMEELMRFAFSRKDFGGILLWVWWQGNLWRDDLASFLANTDFSSNATGKRWKKLKDTLWVTNTSGTTGTDGDYKFNGYYGTYEITIGTAPYTFDFVPESKIFTLASVSHKLAGNEKTILLKGKKVALRAACFSTEPIYFVGYSLSGKLLFKIPIHPYSVTSIPGTPKGIFIYRIENGKGAILTAQGLSVDR
jgi:endo-1,4-beta-xylanase